VQEETTSRTEGTQKAGQDEIEIARVHVRKEGLQPTLGRGQFLSMALGQDATRLDTSSAHGEIVLQGWEEFP
jgi:hypothetical protein